MTGMIFYMSDNVIAKHSTNEPEFVGRLHIAVEEGRSCSFQRYILMHTSWPLSSLPDRSKVTSSTLPIHRDTLVRLQDLLLSSGCELCCNVAPEGHCMPKLHF